jgi:hypothetical protein
MRINVAVPEDRISAPILNAALEGVTRLDEELIRSGAAPPFRQAVGRVQWKPEPPGQEHFDHAGLVMRRRWGDCDDLGPWHAASLRVTGEDPDAHAVVRRSGPKRWHVVVRRSDGSIDDPSIEAGMPGPGRKVGINGAWQPPMFQRSLVSGVYIPTPQLALRPIPDRHGRPESWQARADLPWHWQPGKSASDVAMVSLHRTPVSDQALVGCVTGAIKLGECSGYADEDHLDRLAAIRDMVDGATWEEVADEYGPQHADAASAVVGSFFGKIFKKVTKAARGLAAPAVKLATGKLGRTALSFVPGVGPVASMALSAASPHLRKLVRSGRHVAPSKRPAYQHALAKVPRGVPPHRHAVFTGPPIPL